MSYCPGHAQWRHFWAEANQLKVTMEGWPIRIQGGCTFGSLRPTLLFQQSYLSTRHLFPARSPDNAYPDKRRV